MATERKIDCHDVSSINTKEHCNLSQDDDNQAAESLTSEDLNLQVMLKEYDSKGLALAIANGEYPGKCLDNSKSPQLAEMPPKTEFVSSLKRPFTVPELKFIVQSVDDLCGFIQDDPNAERSLEVTNCLQKSVQCYRELLEEKKAKPAKQSTIGDFFVKKPKLSKPSKP